MIERLLELREVPFECIVNIVDAKLTKKCVSMVGKPEVNGCTAVKVEGRS